MRRTVIVVLSLVASAAALPVGNAQAIGEAQAKASVCSKALGSVSGPGRTVAWRAGIERPTAVFDWLPSKSLRPSHWLTPAEAPWLLVLAGPRTARARCWVKVRLPWRPNDAAGWVNVNNVFIEQTRWRIAISTARRTLTLYRAGAPVRTASVVVGKPSTPTPAGLFAVTWAIPWHPEDFLGSWVLELTAHSDVLAQFEGGDGTVGIHGRGGASLLDPLGSAASHGCIRLSNASIDWLVRTIGASELPGTAVQIS
jgi:lipoprotein-anchoring transpeptidase ErfK/SrfK